MRFDPRILLGVCAAQLTVVGYAEADQGQAVLTGIVRNASTNAGIEGVVVVVTSNSLQGEQTVTTDRTGHYRLPHLPPGQYRFQVLGNNFKPYSRTDITLRADATIRFDPKIIPAGEEVRDVFVAAPTVDVGSSSTGVSLDQDFNRRVPIVSPGGKGSANRSFEAVAQATPGARADRYGTSVSGTTSPENQYLVDGMPVNNAAYGINGLNLSSEFVSEVKVVSGGYMPEYGRAQGGIISAVTKSGSNEFHGGVWAYYSPGALEGKGDLVKPELSTIRGDGSLRYIGDVGFDIGGPLIKDKLWFYFGADISRSVYDLDSTWHKFKVIDEVDDPDDPEQAALLGTYETDENGDPITQEIARTRQTYVADGTDIQAVAKLSFRANENHSFALGGVFAPRFAGGDGKYSVGPASGAPEVGVRTGRNGELRSLAHTQHGNSMDATLKWNASTKDKAWVFDTTLGYHSMHNTRLPMDGSSVGSSQGLAGVPLVIWRGTDSYGNPHNQTDLVDMPGGADESECDPVDIDTGEDLDGDGENDINSVPTCPNQRFVTGGPGFIYDKKLRTLYGSHIITYVLNAGGHHVIKFGGDATHQQYNSNRGYTGKAIYYENRQIAPVFLTFRQYGYLKGPDDGEVLANLDHKVSTIIAGGFLQDSWSIADTFTVNLGARYDVQQVYAHGGRVTLSLPNQISPRAGFIYDFTQKGRSKIFANYARFYQAVPLDLADRMGSGEPQIYGVHLCEDPVSELDECRENLDDYPATSDVNSKWHVLGAGITPVDPDLKPPSSDEIVGGAEYEIITNARLGASYTKKWLNRFVEDMSRDEATTYFLGNPGEGIAKDFPAAERDYDAVNVYFQKTFSKHWLASGSYTMAWLRGNIAGLFRPETGQLDPFINSDFDLISLLPNRIGRLPGDYRHTIKLYGAGEIPLPGSSFITIGGSARARSGAARNALGGHDLYGANEVFIIPRGSYEDADEPMPWVFNLDASLGYGFQFTEHVRVMAEVAAFNVANFQAITGRDDTWTYDAVLPIIDGDAGDLPDLTLPDGETPATKNVNFGNATAYQVPRRLRFGLRFEF